MRKRMLAGPGKDHPMDLETRIHFYCTLVFMFIILPLILYLVNN